MEFSEGSPLRPTVFSAMSRYRWLAGTIVVAATGLGLVIGIAQTPKATATASVVVQDPQADALFNAGSSGVNYVQDQISIMTLPIVSERAAATLATNPADQQITAQEFEDNVKVSADEDSSLIRVAFTDADPQRAKLGADTLVSAYQATLKDRQTKNLQASLAAIDAEVANLDQQITAAGGPAAVNGPVDSNTSSTVAVLSQAKQQLVQRRAQLVVDAGGDSTGVAVFSPAPVPTLSDNHAPIRLGLLGALVGLILAAGAAYLMAARRQRFDDRTEPELVLDRPLLTDVPNFRAERLPSDLPVFDSATSSAAEAFRFAIASLALRDGSRGHGLYAVTSPASGDGKTTLAANLAVVAAQGGRSVLVIDGDLEGQGLSWLLLGENRATTGLVQIVEGSASLDDAVIRAAVGDAARIDVLPGGRASRRMTDLFASAEARDLFAAARQRYDTVIVDVPSILQKAYGTALARHADTIITVVSHRSPIGRAGEMAERLRFLGLDSIGYVYTKAPLRRELGLGSKLVTDSRRRGDAPSRHHPRTAAAAHRANGSADPSAGPSPAGSSPAGATAGSAAAGPVINGSTGIGPAGSAATGSPGAEGR